MKTRTYNPRNRLKCQQSYEEILKIKRIKAEFLKNNLLINNNWITTQPLKAVKTFSFSNTHKINETFKNLFHRTPSINVQLHSRANIGYILGTAERILFEEN